MCLVSGWSRPRIGPSSPRGAFATRRPAGLRDLTAGCVTGRRRRRPEDPGSKCRGRQGPRVTGGPGQQLGQDEEGFLEEVTSGLQLGRQAQGDEPACVPGGAGRGLAAAGRRSERCPERGCWELCSAFVPREGEAQAPLRSPPQTASLAGETGQRDPVGMQVPDSWASGSAAPPSLGFPICEVETKRPPCASAVTEHERAGRAGVTSLSLRFPVLGVGTLLVPLARGRRPESTSYLS